MSAKLIPRMKTKFRVDPLLLPFLLSMRDCETTLGEKARLAELGKRATKLS